VELECCDHTNCSLSLASVGRGDGGCRSCTSARCWVHDILSRTQTGVRAMESVASGGGAARRLRSSMCSSPTNCSCGPSVGTAGCVTEEAGLARTAGIITWRGGSATERHPEATANRFILRRTKVVAWLSARSGWPHSVSRCRDSSNGSHASKNLIVEYNAEVSRDVVEGFEGWLSPLG